MLPIPTQSPLVHRCIQPSWGAAAALQSKTPGLGARIGHKITAHKRANSFIWRPRNYRTEEDFCFFLFTAQFYYCCKTREPGPNVTTQCTPTVRDCPERTTLIQSLAREGKGTVPSALIDFRPTHISVSHLQDQKVFRHKRLF